MILLLRVVALLARPSDLTIGAFRSKSLRFLPITYRIIGAIHSKALRFLGGGGGGEPSPNKELIKYANLLRRVQFELDVFGIKHENKIAGFINDPRQISKGRPLKK